MAPRSNWKGYLKLSLVSCPIALYPAIDASERLSFRQVNRVTGNRLRHQLVDSLTGEVVEANDKGRGYEVGEKQFVLVEDEELEEARAEARTKPFGAAPAATGNDELRPPTKELRKREAQKPLVEEAEIVAPPRQRVENTRTIDIERFMPRSQIDPRYHHTPYYVAPRDVMGHEAFAVIRDAMAGKDVVAMGHIVLSNRERPIILEPLGLGLRGTTLRYAHEIRREAEYFADIPQMQLPAQMVSLAGHIVDKMLGDFDPALLEDRYRTVLVSKLSERRSEITKRGDAAVPSRANVINLMEILQRSLAAGQPQTIRPKHGPARRTVAAASNPSPAKRTRVRGRSSQ
jgi:DNA end-binding protein Ku